MKIAVTFPGCHRRGGIERVVLECANFLRSRGHDVQLIASEWDDAVLDDGVTRLLVRTGGPAWTRMLQFAWRSRSKLVEMTPPPDVHAAFGVHSPPDGVVWVPSVHRAWLETSRRLRGIKGRLKQRINPFHVVACRLEKGLFGRRRYRRLIAHTAEVRADLVRLYAVPESDIEILPNGFSPREFHPGRADADREMVRRELGFRESDRVIVFVANELERKGFRPLLRATAALKDPNVKILVAGRVTPGGYSAEMERLGMSDSIRFVGPSSDVGRYFAAGDLFALPTQYEAWGLVIAEALACGLPVLTSRLAGAAVAVQEGITGELLDDPRDEREIEKKLTKLLESPPADRHRISATVSHLSWDHILPRYEQILIANANVPREPAVASGAA